MKDKPSATRAGWLSRYRNNVLLQRLSTVLAIDVLVKLSGIILLPVYLKLMTQEEYGLYGYLISIVTTFSIVLNFGLYIPLSKYYHDLEDRAQKARLLFTLAVCLLLLLLLVLLPLYIFGGDYSLIDVLFKNQINYDRYRAPVLLAVVATVLNFMLSNFFFASEKIRQAKHYNIWRICCINVVTLAALLSLRVRDNVQTRLAFTYSVELILFLFFLRHFIREVTPILNRKLIGPSLRLALPIMISAIFGIVINFSDKFFLEKYGSFRDLSYYYLAVSCASVIPMIYTSFQNAWLPLFLKEKDLATNLKKTNKFLARLFVVFVIISLAIMLFLKILVGTGIIDSKYHKTLSVLPIILLAQTLNALVPLYSNYLVYFSKTYIAGLAGAAICVLAVSLSQLLIPVYGVYGAAFVSLVSAAVYLGVYFLVVRHHSRKYLVNLP